MSWKVDNAHTQVQFSVRHMMISKVRGTFEKFGGTVNLDETHPANTTVEIQVETASVNTKDAQRDGHLRSADFFQSEQYPYMTFKSTGVKVLDNTHAILFGDLTIRDVTRPAVLDVEYCGQAKSPWGMTSMGFNGHTTINRRDWNLVWNVALETGGVLVSEDVEIFLELELVNVPEAQLEAVA
jgi:polyisoprenoid-binding protein YceI